MVFTGLTKLINEREVSCAHPSLGSIHVFDLCAAHVHARALMPAVMASVPFGCGTGPGSDISSLPCKLPLEYCLGFRKVRIEVGEVL